MSIAWYQGNLRRNYFLVSVSTDGVNYRDVYTGTSSGMTADLESYAFQPTAARNVRITVNGNTVNNWASISELQIAASIGACGKLNVSSISASTDDGNVPANATDGNVGTRWSGLGIGAYITADLGSSQMVCSVSIAWYHGNLRRNYFLVSISTDGVNYRDVYTGTSSGTTADFESYALQPTAARSVRITVNGNTVNNWASISELQITASMGAYDQSVLADHPVAFWGMNSITNTEPDLTGNRNVGSYRGGLPTAVVMPNGDRAAAFNGSGQYLSVPSNSSLSIPTTHNLTWEMWIQPAVMHFPNSGAGYIDLMGKCASYSPTCEWEARLYDTANPEGRCNRISAYVFNSTAGKGSSADWQQVCGLLKAGRWIHIVGEYTTLDQPTGCLNTSNYPGSIDIWVNGVKWNQSAHNPTGCMSQYSVTPEANSSPLNIATMAGNTWFQGAIGKVAIYDYKLTQTQITSHYQAMTGNPPTGICTKTCSF